MAYNYDNDVLPEDIEKYKKINNKLKDIQTDLLFDLNDSIDMQLEYIYEIHKDLQAIKEDIKDIKHDLKGLNEGYNNVDKKLINIIEIIKK